ncbi:MAG: FAD-dependent oxidoreductase [Bacilli bacterium]
MKKQSIWSDIIINNKEKCLKQDIKTDILIIGGGITGITAGLFLKDFKVTLIEQNIIGMGISSKSTGKLTFLQDEILLNIIKAHNEPTAYLYYLAQLDAIKLVVNTIKKYNINCDLTKNHGYVYTNDPKKLKKIKKLENFFQKYNIKYDIITNLPNKLPCLYGLRVNDTYVFNPVKYIIELKEIISNYITIYEHTKALTITFENNYYIIKTNSNIIKAKKVIVATHYPFFIKPGFLPFKSYISKSYVLAANENNHQKINAYSSTLPITSFRYYLNYFIYASSFKKKSNDNENHHDLINNYQQYFNHKITYIWSSQDIMTNDFLPYIGKVNNNLYWATGYNKWGLTNGSIGAKLLTDLIKNKPNKYTNLFN